MNRQDWDDENRRQRLYDALGPIGQAISDWYIGKAYIDGGGNYRLRTERHYRGGRWVWTGRGKVAPWNRVARAVFPSSAELHDAAEAMGAMS